MKQPPAANNSIATSSLTYTVIFDSVIYNTITYPKKTIVPITKKNQENSLRTTPGGSNSKEQQTKHNRQSLPTLLPVSKHKLISSSPPPPDNDSWTW
jgi:hypothetical protein